MREMPAWTAVSVAVQVASILPPAPALQYLYIKKNHNTLVSSKEGSRGIGATSLWKAVSKLQSTEEKQVLQLLVCI